jgi:hypothetical protein
VTAPPGRTRAASPDPNVAAPRPLAYGVDDFAKAAGVGRDAIYDAIRNGKLTARKVGSRTIILEQDGTAWLRGLPTLPQRT